MKIFARSLVRVFWSFLAFAFVTLADPMGITGYAKTAAQRLILSLEAFDSKFSNSKANIVVVLLDEAFLESQGITYPIPHILMGDLVSAISETNPEAIYLHFSFGYDRGDPGTAYLGETIKGASEKSRVFIAAANDSSPSAPILSEIACPHDTDECGFEELPFRLVSDGRKPDDSPITSYWTRDPERRYSKPGLLIACSTIAPEAVQACENNVPEYFDPIWPVPPPVCNGTMTQPAPCNEIADTAFEYFWRKSLSNILGNISPTQDPDSAISKLYPFRTIGFDAALSGTLEIEAALNGAIVLVGFESPSSGGYAQSANYGPKPGVYLEAAAIQTMLAEDLSPPNSRNAPQSSIDNAMLIYGGLIFIGLGVVRMLVHNFFGRPSNSAAVAIDFIVVSALGAGTLFVHQLLLGVVSASLLLVLFSLPIAIFANAFEGRD
ncbi:MULTISPECIES: CHASE2 domain-containing protein [Hyphomonas]